MVFPLSQQDTILRYTESFPEDTELSLALLHGDSVTLVGVRRVAGELQSADNTEQLFEIGSVTKVFTAGILAGLVTDNIVQLDDPIQSLLPVALREPEREGVAMTLRHLANHTSGLPRLPDNLTINNPSDPYADYDSVALYDYLQHQQSLNATPGTQSAYSNLGVGLLGHLLTQRTETKYETLLQEYITEPLALRRTFATVPTALAEARVKGRDPVGHVTPPWNLGVLAGAGVIKSTAHDLAIWLRANLDESLPTHALWKRCQTPTFTVNEGLSMGLGWHILSMDGRTVYWHNGGTGGYRSSVAVDTENETGVVVLSNVSAFSPHAENIDALGFRLLELLNE